MEKFKACEKEMKTKAFSKEGLIAATRLDPKEKAKHEQSEWLSTMVGELERQVEQTEAELGLMVSGGKKKSKAGANNRQEELVHMNSRRTWHISRLEIVLRLLENGTLSPETVADLREDVSYFVESNTVRKNSFSKRPPSHPTPPDRKKSLTKTKGYMTTLIWMPRRKPLVLWEMTTILMMRNQ